MTKREFLTGCDFNNLSLKDKIQKVIELYDGWYEEHEADTKLKEDFHTLESISRELQRNKFDIEKTYLTMISNDRENILNKLEI